MGNYRFDLRPDGYWLLYASGKGSLRLYGRGCPFTDRYLTKYLNSLDNGMVTLALACMIKHYDVHGKPNLIDVKEDGFLHIKGERDYLSDAIGEALQRLVDELL